MNFAKLDVTPIEELWEHIDHPDETYRKLVRDEILSRTKKVPCEHCKELEEEVRDLERRIDSAIYELRW